MQSGHPAVEKHKLANGFCLFSPVEGTNQLHSGHMVDDLRAPMSEKSRPTITTGNILYAITVNWTTNCQLVDAETAMYMCKLSNYCRSFSYQLIRLAWHPANCSARRNLALTS